MPGGLSAAAPAQLLQPEVRYRGRIVSAAGVSTYLEKITTMRDWPIPYNLKELPAFLGTVECYRQYLWDFATNAKPLNRLTAKGTEWICEDEGRTSHCPGVGLLDRKSPTY